MTPLDRIDTAINDAASRMTSAKPSGTLRANVMSRIAAERPTRLHAWRVGAAFGSIAGVAIVAVISLHNRAIPNSPIPTPTPINPTIINSTAAVNPTAATNATSPLASVTRTAAADNGGRSALATLADADQEWLAGSVPALERPELIAPVKPLLEGAPIKTIDVEPIRVAPLVVLAIGDDNR